MILKHGVSAKHLSAKELVKLEIEYSDGSINIISSDETWKTHSSHRTLIGGWGYKDFG